MLESCSNTVTTFSYRCQTHLLYGVEDVLVNVVLCVNSEGVVRGLVVVFEEEVLERHGVLFLEGHHHMVAEAKEHQLRQDGGKVFKDEEASRTLLVSVLCCLCSSFILCRLFAQGG